MKVEVHYRFEIVHRSTIPGCCSCTFVRVFWALCSCILGTLKMIAIAHNCKGPRKCKAFTSYKSVRGESDRRTEDQTWSSTVPWTEDQTRSSTVRRVHKGRLMQMRFAHYNKDGQMRPPGRGPPVVFFNGPRATGRHFSRHMRIIFRGTCEMTGVGSMALK